MDTISKVQAKANVIESKLNCEKCNDNNPCISFLDLIYILLKKFKKLLTVELWDYASTLFPYYEELWDPIQGNEEIHKILDNNRGIFIFSHHIPACPGVFIVTLMPRYSFSLDIEGAYGNPLKTALLSHKKDLVQWLTDEGTGMIVPAYRRHPRPALSSYVSGFSPESSPITDIRLSDTESDDTPVSKRYCNEENRIITTNNDQDFTSDLEIVLEKCSKKNISVHCNETIENVFMEISPQKSSHVDSTSSSLKLNFIDQIKFTYMDLGNCMVSKGFTLPRQETMWKDDYKELPIVNHTMNSLRSAFSEYSKRHKWLKLSDLSNLIVCSSCKYIEHKYGVVGLSLHIPLQELHASNFLKLIHRHSEQKSHKAAHLIARKELSTSLRFILLNHFNDFSNFSNLIEILQRLLPDEIVTLDDLQVYVSLLGEYLEFEILDSAKRAECISMIADPCRGYLILRFIKDSVPVEHILSSYMSCTDKSPAEYVSKLLPEVRVPFYMCNKVCKSCHRCKVTKTEKIPAIPLALPRIELFQMFLWRTKIFSEFFVFASTVLRLCQMLENSELEEQICLKRLTKFPIVPSELVRLYSFEKIIKNAVNSIESSDVGADVELIMAFDWSRLQDFRQVFLLLEDLNMCLLRLNQDISAFDELYVHLERFQAYGNSKFKDAIDIMKWEEVSSLITSTVRELQYTVYHKRRYLLSSFKTATNFKNLSEHDDSKLIRESFNKLYQIVQMNEPCDDSESFRCCLKKFLKSHSHLEGKSTRKVLQYFKENTYAKQNYPRSFQFYSTMSLIGFQKTSSPRSLYEMQIFENQFHMSAWSSLGANTKPHLLTIVSELAAGTKVREQRMAEFFFAVI